MVKAGENLGLGGSTGNSTGTHLHLEMRFKGFHSISTHIISFKDRKLFADTLVLKKTRRSYAAYPAGVSISCRKKGDYIHRIAKRYGISSIELCEWNNIRPQSKLVLGQRLRIAN